MGWMTGFQCVAEETDFSLFHSVKTGSGAHPASYPIGTLGSILRGKEAEA
jgi:hypothetical protein